jgi:hypothetical protein
MKPKENPRTPDDYTRLFQNYTLSIFGKLNNENNGLIFNSLTYTIIVFKSKK